MWLCKEKLDIYLNMKPGRASQDRMTKECQIHSRTIYRLVYSTQAKVQQANMANMAPNLVVVFLVKQIKDQD